MNGINKFIEKVNRANNAKSKQLVLTIEEAIALSNDLSKLLLDLTAVQKQVIELHNELKSNISLDGGKF